MTEHGFFVGIGPLHQRCQGRVIKRKAMTGIRLVADDPVGQKNALVFGVEKLRIVRIVASVSK